MRLKEKNALITGSASGIGQAIALEFARQGANVAIADIQDERGEQVRSEIEKNGVRSVFVHCDVSRPDQVQSTFESVCCEFGRLDILVNNAAIIHCAKVVELEIEDWQRVLDVNLTGYFYFCRIMARHLIKTENRGKILNISSIHSRISAPIASHDAAARGGVVHGWAD